MPEGCQQRELVLADCPQRELVLADCPKPVLMLAGRIDPDWSPGMRVQLREGCDRTVATCAARFGNAVNFQGEPFLPGNDMLAQYPVAR